MAERQHSEQAAKRRSKGGKAHGADEPMRQHELGAADFWHGKSHRGKELVRQHSDRWEAEFSVSLVSDVQDKGAPGSLATPIAVAVGALVLGKMFGGYAPSTMPAPGPAPSLPSNVPSGSILSGLGELIGKLTAGGAAPQVNSWVGPGANEPIEPGQLGSALGQNTLNELSQRTGMSQQELLNQLAAVLPKVIHQMTPNNRVPTPADLEKDDFRTVLLRVTNPAQKISSWGADHLEHVSTLLGGRFVLGSTIENDLEAHELLHRGLPRAALSSLVDKLQIIGVGDASEALGMSIRTFQRHKNTPVLHLDVQQSGRTWKFAEILTKATRVFGSQDEAEQWLKRPAIGLDRKRPVDLLTTPAGVKLVEDYLERLAYDVYT
jgi:putative toxin-antitoxin system antitoxin component (TIGR02293 family)